MAVGKFMKSGGFAALAAGLAVLALPASAQAQERGQGRWNRGGGEATVQNDNGGGNWRGNRGGHDRRGGRSEQPAPAPAPQAQDQVQVQAPPQRNWSRGDSEGTNRWRNNNTVQVQPAPTQQAQRERRDWSGNGQWQGQSRWQGRDRTDRNDARRRDDNNDNRWRADNGNTWRGNNDYRWRGDRQNYARNWNRDWRRDDRYDWRGYRNSNRNTYRLGTYYAPYRNYSYRHLSAGFFLDTLFFGSRYWIDDPWQYRLPPTDGPYRWVRYYDDALLVDTYSGEVVDVIYSFFW